jgi:hypothetical protein
MRKMQADPKDIQQERDIRNVVMDRLRMIPCMGLLMALLSGFFFATAGFTVDLMDHVDAAFVVTTRYVLQIL